MPLIHTRVFRVRHYECGPHGQVRQPVYLRYAQEAAFDASAAAGYDLARYASMNRIWLARDTAVKYLHPLSYGDSVEVKTWVLDFRRVRSRRAYEFRRLGSGELVAQASTDWVFLRQSTGHPAPIPDELKEAFFPVGLPPSGAVIERFPAAPSPPPTASRQLRRVEWRDLDPVGHVNNAIYLSFILSGMALIGAGEPSHGRDPGSGLVARSHRIEYLQPALLGDEIDVLTWLDQAKNEHAQCHTLMTRASNGAKLARALSVLD
jgi:acyl-CoA thioesterase FadM